MMKMRTINLGAGAKDELHVVEAEAMNCEGSPIKVNTGNFENICTADGFP